MNVLVVGGGAREHAICSAVKRNEARLYSVMKNLNPGIKKIAYDFFLHNETETGLTIMEMIKEMDA